MKSDAQTAPACLVHRQDLYSHANLEPSPEQCLEGWAGTQSLGLCSARPTRKACQGHTTASPLEAPARGVRCRGRTPRPPCYLPARDSGMFLRPLSLDFSQLSNEAEGCQELQGAPITSQEMRDGRLPIFPSFTFGWPGPVGGCTLPPPLQAAHLPLDGTKCLGT